MVKLKAVNAFTSTEREISTDNKYIHLYIKRNNKLKNGNYSFGVFCYLKTGPYDYRPPIKLYKIKSLNIYYHYYLHLYGKLDEIEKVFNERLPELQRKMIRQLYEYNA